MNLQFYTKKVESGNHLSREEMNEAATYLFDHLEEKQAITDFLIALHNKKESVEELVGLVDIVMKHKIPFQMNGNDYFDNCGTGGDKLNTFNISTTTAFVLAGAGMKIAKHGNRKISSQSGSSDVLEALGIHLLQSPEQVKQQLLEHELAFLHAPNFHPKLGELREVRSAIPHGTIFNYIGPLCNPLAIETQLVGINRIEMLSTYAKALQLLGRKRAIVLCGEKGLDEASLAGTTHYALLADNEIQMFEVYAEQIGLESAPIEAIQGGSADENAQKILDILSGVDSIYTQTVLINAAFGLYANGKTNDLASGISLAQESILSGKALAKLQVLQQFHSKVGIA